MALRQAPLDVLVNPKLILLPHLTPSSQVMPEADARPGPWILLRQPQLRSKLEEREGGGTLQSAEYNQQPHTISPRTSRVKTSTSTNQSRCRNVRYLI